MDHQSEFIKCTYRPVQCRDRYQVRRAVSRAPGGSRHRYDKCIADGRQGLFWLQHLHS